MAVESEAQRSEFQRWSRLAIQLRGAAETGRFEDIMTSFVMRELEQNRLFETIVLELPTDVWTISKLTDADRHKLSHQWRMLARPTNPSSFTSAEAI